MDWKINFSPEAKMRKYFLFIKRMVSKCSKDFTVILNNKVQNILSFPKLYPSIQDKPNIRKCVILIKVTLYYRIDEYELEVITLFDTRQDPGKLNI